MEARSLTVPTSSATPAAQKRRSGGCGCGCGGECGDHHDVCCGLDCITAPRYFCGQLLTDQDLDALVRWSRDKGRLARYRHGWGVVCGLDVHCHPDRPGAIAVAPGYAISCCGDDVVVCEEAVLDLSTACVGDLDPCGELRERPRARAVDRPTLPQGPIAEASGPGRAPEPFDVFIAYDEQPADLRAALARAACSEAAACEHARVRESFTLAWSPGGTGDPVTAAATAWKDGYDHTLDVLDAFQGAFAATIDPDQAGDLRAWLLRWIDRHPLHHFCFLRDRICDAEDAALVSGALISELLFWLVQDARNAYLQCACHGCTAGTGVPLARVWLQPPNGRHNGGCHVAGIDPYWPYRRELRTECWPAPPGAVNLAQLIWHRPAEACVRLQDLGIELDGVTDWDPPEDLAQLRRVLECSPFVACGERRRVVVYDAGVLDRRVVGFCEGAPQPVSRPPKLTLTKASDTQEGRPGAGVEFTFTVVNEGDEAFHVWVEDDVLGAIGDRDVAPGATETFTKPWTVPNQGGGAVTNTATATATGPGGTTDVSATHTFQVLGAPQENLTLDVVIDGPSEAAPNETVRYRYGITNSGDVDLRVTAEDSQTLNLMPQEARDGFDLPIASNRSFYFVFTVPTDTSHVDEVVRAIGRSALGTEVREEARHGMNVRGVDGGGDDRLRAIRGVGAARAEALNQAGVHTLEELVLAEPERIARELGGVTTAAAVRDWQDEARRLLRR